VRLQNSLAIFLAAAFLSGCAGVIQLKARGGGATATCGGKSVLFDDFEKKLGGPWNYGDTANGGSCNMGAETSNVHAGSNAMKIDYKSGTGTWGCGSGWTTNYMPTAGYFDASGTCGVEFWAKAPIGANFFFSIKEGKQNGGDDEVYNGPAVTGNGRWKKYYVKFESFTRGIYSGNQSGDDSFSNSSLVAIDVQISEKQGDGTVYFDDIVFK